MFTNELCKQQMLYQIAHPPYYTELNDLRIIICWKKSEVSVEIISVCKVTEKLAKHVIQCLDTNDVINLLPQQVRVYIKVKRTSLRHHSPKVLSTALVNSMVAKITDPESSHL